MLFINEVFHNFQVSMFYHYMNRFKAILMAKRYDKIDYTNLQVLIGLTMHALIHIQWNLS